LVRARDFFTGADGQERLFVGLLEEIRRSPLRDTSDVEVAIGLLRLVRENLEHVAYRGYPKNLDTDDDIALVLKVLRAVLGRVDVEWPDLPFRDYASLRLVFVRNGWQHESLRREERLLWVADLLEPAAARLEDLEQKEFERSLVQLILPPRGQGWQEVDEEIAGLRSMFAAASTSQQFANVGNACVRVLESVGEVVHDLEPAEPALTRDKSKERIVRFVETRLSGSDNAELRRLARTAVALAHHQKHRTNPTRRDVGMTADAVLVVVNMLRWVAGETEKKTSTHA
jgi:hypothetical protein